ncbi:MAG: carbon-nitrogen hydrolase family protein [Alcanivorax sp.]
MSDLKVACIQMTSGPAVQENMVKAGEMIEQAAIQGAQFIATPENTGRMLHSYERKLSDTTPQADNPAIPYFSDIVKNLGVTLLVGSMAVKVSDTQLKNRSFLFTPDGEVKATYDKIHMFDVELPTGESHTESKVIKPGEEAVVTKINDDFNAGLSICYDLRFAYLYRSLVRAGANILCIPAAFTVPTGKAHWEVLLRARAIETGSYVIAPAQVGEHDGGRKTYGHSMIIDPWGRILAQQEDGEGIIYATLSTEEVDKARTAIPTLKHDRDYTVKRYGQE